MYKMSYNLGCEKQLRSLISCTKYGAEFIKEDRNGYAELFTPDALLDVSFCSALIA